MEDILREPVELTDEDLDEVAGGLIVNRVTVVKSSLNGGGNYDGGLNLGIEF
jgi:hypothetical protein